MLRYRDDFEPDQGYYTISSIFISQAFLALLRVKTLSQSAYTVVGELGKVMGLDRIPEVKTLRERLTLFFQRTDIHQWAGKLSRDWMRDCAIPDGIFYINGNVAVYYGHQTNMPKRYVTRLKLCMSGSTDYWINDMKGQPYFVVNKVINESMIQTIKQNIIPRLDKDVPNQPTDEQLRENPFSHRYMFVFDRECYSPDFFYDLWQQRIAICTYRKNVDEQWEQSEFQTYQGNFPGGETMSLALAEREVELQSKGSEKKYW